MPNEEILLTPDPKRPRGKGESTEYEEAIKLEELIPGFAAFFDQLVQCSHDDVTDTVPLRPKPDS